MSHTPGPWEIRHNPTNEDDGLPEDFGVPFRGEFFVVNQGHSAVCEFVHAGAEDARLIAAAPEMFALLSRLLDDILMTEDLMNRFAKLDLEQAAAAIRKAKGE